MKLKDTYSLEGFPGGSEGKASACNAGDLGSIPGSGRKVMTNLDIILKSRNSTLPTNFHIVKDKVFPLIIYGCESWSVKKAER